MVDINIKNSRLALVLGMHRSGTSLLTNGLLALGLDLGGNLMPPEADNPKGFWEDLDVVNLNEAIINRLCHWSQITPNFESLQMLASPEERLQAIDLINNKLRCKKLQAIKDPRLSILLPFWQDIFITCGCKTYTILAIRHPMEVALSLHKRNSLSIEQGLLLWLYYNLHCLKEVQNELLVVSFEELLVHPKAELHRIGAFIGIQYSSTQVQDFADNVIEKGLRHNRSDKTISCQDTDFASEINTLYDQLLVESKKALTIAEIFRDSEKEQYALLTSKKLYEKFSTEFNTATQFKLRHNSSLYVGVRNSQIIPADFTATEVDSVLFPVADKSEGVAQLEMPEKPCIIKIEQLDATMENSIKQTLYVHNGNYCLHYNNIYVFNSSAPYLNVKINSGTKSVHLQYQILRDSYQTIRYREAYDDIRSGEVLQNNSKIGNAHLLLRLRGYDFNPRHSLSKEIYSGTTKITFDLSDYREKDIQEIRFNPCNEVVVVSLHSCTIEYDRGASYTLPSKSILTNAIVTEDSNFIFLTKDSCVILDIPADKRVGIHRIVIYLDYINWGLGDNEGSCDEINNIINQQKELLACKDAIIKSQIGTISELKEQSDKNYLIPLRYERQKNIKKHKSQKILRIISSLKKILRNPKEEIDFYRTRRAIGSTKLFDEQYYLNNNLDLVPGCIDTFRHFYFEGWKEGRNPNPDFDIKFYLSNYADVKNSKQNPLVHYMMNGESEQRFTSKLHREITTIKQSGFFDSEWYLEQYPLTKSIEPIEHYCLYGFKENKSPFPLFDTAFYREEYCGIKKDSDELNSQVTMNPLVHYILEGKSKNNLTYSFTRDSILRLLPKLRHQDIYTVITKSNLVLEDFYASQLKDHCEDLVNHYITVGFCLGLKPNPFFNNDYYINQFPELKSYNIPPLLHYTLFGSKVGAAPCEFFDPGFYNTYYTNVTDLGIDPLAHFLTWGWNEWRRPKMEFFTPYFICNSGSKIDSVEKFADAIDSYSPPNLDANTYPNYVSWYNEESPDVSIVILNWHKSFLTLDCLISLWQFTTGFTYEIIIVDNGSNFSEKQILKSLSPFVTIVDLDVNRFYGEGNNIGVEHSKGEYIILLNNDTIATPNWLLPLVNGLISNPDAGVTGAKLLFPDGSIQEMGVLVDADGNIEQLGKHTPNNTNNSITEVDYVSGACLAIRKDDFSQILGFDYIWEPAYYEDNDLCWKIKLLEKRVLVVPECEIYHLEHVSISNQQELNFSPIIDQNKKKFLARWKNYITNKELKPNLVLNTVPNDTISNPEKPNALLYTPYPILLGGGERYLLTIAEYLQLNYNVYLVLPELYSKLRILTVGRDLGLQLGELQILKFEELNSIQINFDLSVVMGNEILPRVPAIAKKNVFHCQFPFKYHFEENGFQKFQVDYYNGYDCILVNSEFTKFNIQKQQREYSLKNIPVQIAYPPVGDFSTGDVGDLISNKETRHILSIGRFFVGGHNKKHDFLIKAFKSLVDKYGYGDIQLNLVGGTHTESMHRKYVDHLQELAVGYNIVFHFDLSNEAIAELLKFSSIYWHATGIDVDPIDYPEAMEHFGITPVEAMQSCCIPIVPNKGGVCEIVRGCSSQTLTYRNQKELTEVTHKLFNLNKSEIDSLRHDVVQRSHSFGKETFLRQFEHAVNDL